MKRSNIAICAFLAVSSFASTAQTNYFGDRGEDIPRPQQPVMKHEFAEVIMSALNNQEGYSKAEVSGPLALRLKNDNKTKSPMFVEVRRLGKIEDIDQSDCYNMRMRITMPELIGTGGKKVDFGYDMQMCSDGRPPQSVIEREKRQFRALLQQQQEQQRQRNAEKN